MIKCRHADCSSPYAQDQRHARASRQALPASFNEMAEDCMAGLLHLWKAQPRLVLGAARGGLLRAIADALEAGEARQRVG